MTVAGQHPFIPTQASMGGTLLENPELTQNLSQCEHMTQEVQFSKLIAK